MDLFSLVAPVLRAFASLQLDDSTVSVLAMLLGIVGGWTVASFAQQMKAKRVKVERKQPPTLRKPD